jgi:hypothetical protein
MVRGGYDDVRGVIIGGDYVSWRLYYDDRPQGGTEYADSEEEAVSAGRLLCSRLKREFCGWPCYLYPDNSKWEVRVYFL